MTVTTHVAWYWRMLGVVVVLSCSLVLATWMYDAGRRYAGFDRSEVEQEMSQLRESVNKLTEESTALRAGVNASESKLQTMSYVGEKRSRRIRNAALAAVFEYLSG